MIIIKIKRAYYEVSPLFNIDTYQHLQLTYLIADENDGYGY